MKKILHILLIAFIVLLPYAVYAQSVTPPAETLWVTPPDAQAGDTVSIHAFLYNSQTQAITFTVAFAARIASDEKAPEKEITTQTVTIGAQSAQTLTIDWTMPEKEMKVTVAVTKALTKLKKDETALHGTFGTVTIGASHGLAVPNIAIPNTEGIKVWLAEKFKGVEAYRLKHAKQFAELRAQSRANLGIDTIRNIEDPVDISGVQYYNGERVSTNKGVDYFNLLYSSSMGTIFASMPLFYITFVLLLFLILRFILKRFI